MDRADGSRNFAGNPDICSQVKSLVFVLISLSPRDLTTTARRRDVYLSTVQLFVETTINVVPAYVSLELGR